MYVNANNMIFTCMLTFEESWNSPRRGPRAGVEEPSAFMKLMDTTDLKERQRNQKLKTLREKSSSKGR